MTLRRTFFIHSQFTARAVVLFALLLAAGWTDSEQVKQSATPRTPRKPSGDRAVRAERQRFLEMFARAYFPGPRTNGPTPDRAA
jgi:hypothetical protein